jgi:hypothetical protein
MTTTMEVFDVTYSITQGDIDAGVRRNCELCPGAQAIARALRRYGLDGVSVGPFNTWAGEREGERNDKTTVRWAYVATNPSDLYTFIEHFDSGYDGLLPPPMSGMLTFRRLNFSGVQLEAPEVPDCAGEKGCQQ